jgi:hypothetical protein
MFLYFVITYHYDCEVIVVDKVSIHPILGNVLIGKNIADHSQKIDANVYNDVISMLQLDGIC